MKKTLLLSVAVLAMSGASVFAADMPVRGPVAKAPPVVAGPLFNWTGFYWGGVAGYAWGDSSHTNAAGVTSGDFKTDGWMAGGTVGYNWQNGAGVFGLEGDFSWANPEGSGTVPGGVVNTELNWFATARARAGIASDQFLWYVTGGAAFAKLDASFNGVTSGSSTRTGWTAGAGVEAMITPNWTTKLEYLYADLGDKAAYNAPSPIKVDYTTHIVRVGLNYKY
jgi:outer membrane immunogenic protein